MTIAADTLPRVVTAPGITDDAIEALSSAPGASPDWLRDLRAAGWSAYGRSRMPTRHDEHWRFTDLRRVRLADVAAVTACTDLAGAVRSAPTGIFAEVDLAASMRVANGASAVTTCAELPDGVIFSSLTAAVRDHGDLIRRNLATAAHVSDGVDDHFVALQQATLYTGVFVHVPRNTTVDLPMYARILNAADGGSVSWRAVIVLEEGAQATFIEELGSTDPDLAGFSNAVVEVIAGPGSRLDYVTVQDYAHPTSHFATHRVLADRDAHVEVTALGLGASRGKGRIEARLVGAGADVRVNGVCVIADSQELDYDTRQVHEAPNTTSNLSFRGALRDRSRSVWRGMIEVAPGARGTDAYQENRTLLLDPTTHADCIPGLQIETNEVRCTHGVTIAKVDPEQLFYLQARGLTREDATAEVVRGFFVPTLDRIAREDVRERVRETIFARLTP